MPDTAANKLIAGVIDHQHTDWCNAFIIAVN